ncbi:MAG: zinc-ribbon domain-containing protein [Clostridia bacterium]|nr:zinc-ribbon domain-containing protein [Clostridia bacterium]
MYCSKCGASNEDTAKFCTECGSKFMASEVQNPTVQPPAAPPPVNGGDYGNVYSDGNAYSANSSYPSPDNMYPDNGAFQQPAAQTDQGKLSNVAVVLGAVGLVLAFLVDFIGFGCGIAGLVVSLKAMKQKKDDSKAKIGLVLSIIAIGVFVLNFIIGFIQGVTYATTFYGF